MPPKFCLWILLLLHVRHCCCKLSRKSNEPNLRKWQKIQFQDQFWPLWPKLGPQNFFNRFYLYYMLDIVASYHCMRFQGKLTNQTWENGKKPSFGTYFGPFGPNLGPQKLCSWILLLLHVRHCCKLSRKTNNQTGEYSKKPSFGQPIFFFSKIWLGQSLDIMVSYHHVQYQKNLLIQSWKNLTDGQTVEWFHRTLSN